MPNFLAVRLMPTGSKLATSIKISIVFGFTPEPSPPFIPAIAKALASSLITKSSWLSRVNLFSSLSSKDKRFIFSSVLAWRTIILELTNLFKSKA